MVEHVNLIGDCKCGSRNTILYSYQQLHEDGIGEILICRKCRDRVVKGKPLVWKAAGEKPVEDKETSSADL